VRAFCFGCLLLGLGSRACEEADVLLSLSPEDEVGSDASRAVAVPFRVGAARVEELVVVDLG
jgi:hypothetical protein